MPGKRGDPLLAVVRRLDLQEPHEIPRRRGDLGVGIVFGRTNRRHRRGLEAHGRRRIERLPQALPGGLPQVVFLGGRDLGDRRGKFVGLPPRRHGRGQRPDEPAGLADRVGAGEQQAEHLPGAIRQRRHHRRIHPGHVARAAGYSSERVEGTRVVRRAERQGHPPHDVGIGIIGEREHGVAEAAVAHQERLGHGHGMDPHRGVGMRERRADRGRVAHVERGQRMEGIHDRRPRGRRRDELRDRRGRRRRLSLDEQPPGRLPPPEPLACQFLHERVGRKAVHVGRRHGQRLLRHDLPDPAAVLAVVELVLLLEVTRDRGIVFDDLAVEIDDGHRPVRRVGQGHRVKPDVGRGEELALCLFREARQRHPAVLASGLAADHATRDEVLRGLAGEQLAGEAGQRRVVVEERSAARRVVAVRGRLGDAVAILVELRELGVLLPLGPPGVRLARGIGTVTAEAVFHAADRVVGIAGQRPPRNRRREDAGDRRVDHDLFVAVGEREAERVRAAQERLNRGAVGLEAEVGRRQVDGLCQMRPGDAAAGRPGPRVDPVVVAPLRLVDVALEDAHGEALVEHFADLGHAVAVAVRKVDNLRGRGGDDAVAGGADSVAGGQVVGEDRRLVHHAVAVGVGEQFDRAVGLGVRLGLGLRRRGNPPHLRVELAGLVGLLDVELPLEVVAMEFRDEEPALRIPADARRLVDKRLSRDELHLQSRGHAEGGMRILWRERPGPVGGFWDLGDRRLRQARGQGGCYHHGPPSLCDVVSHDVSSKAM